MNRLCLILLFFLCCITGSRAEVLWRTVKTKDGNITVGYELSYSNNKVKLWFKEVKVNRAKSSKYNRCVLIFYKRNIADNKFSFDNSKEIKIDPFSIPDGLEYGDGGLENGYLNLSVREPSIDFTMTGTDDVELSIPLYVANLNKKKNEYQIISRSEDDLKILLKKPTPKSRSVSTDHKLQSSSPMPSTEAVEDEEFTKIKVKQLINDIKESLKKQTKLPFTEILNGNIEDLRKWLKDINDKQLIEQIGNTLSECDKKQQELKEEADKQEQNAIAKAEKEEREREIKEERKQEAQAAADRKKEKAEEERNLWLIAGGVVLAVLCFIGNQVFQHFRSLRNHKNMMEMQQDIARRAENEAKRHAQNYARQKTDEAVNKTKKNTQQLVRNNKVKQQVNNKSKKISI